MYTPTVLFTLLVLGFAAAQNSTSTFDASQVDQTQKNQWCITEKNTCGDLCGGLKYAKTNDCDNMSLNFTCVCQNGKTPDNLAQYQQTLPFLECQYTFIKCNKANPGSSQCSNNCGNLDSSTIKAGAGAAPTSSAAASSTAPATSTGASPVATNSKNTAGRYVPEAGFAAAVVGAMGMLL